jgi:hypothetical protein
MTYAQPEQTFLARVDGFPTGLTGTVGYQILDDTGAVTVARTTAGITESPADSGSYIATPTAPASAGSYSVAWDTGVVSPSTTAYDDLIVNAAGAPPTPPSDYTPTLEDVAALVPSRAKNQYGRITTFDGTTQPTGTQVQSVIDRAVRSVYGRIGDPADALLDMAKDIVALRAAMLVELTYFGDQIRSDRSPYAALQELYEEALTDYFAARGQLGPDLIPGTADDQLPYYSFPPPVPALGELLDDLDVIEGSGPVDAGGSEIPADRGGGPVW